MPLVAMTREMGSLGQHVAADVSDRLGRDLVHHEIIGVLADKMRLRKSHVVRFLEGKSGIWERLTTDQTSLSIYTADETLRLIATGRVGVLHGWGAAHLLREIPHVIRVRICAPFELRVERMMQLLETDDRALVESEIRASEEAHGAITRRHFGIDWREPELYDLVLNTERMPIECCVAEVMALLEDEDFEETPESRRLLANLTLETHVRAALRADPRTAKANPIVEARDGRLTLGGVLESAVEEEDVVEVARAVEGVSEVESTLRTAAQSRFKPGG
jgi:cytidylate kinase